MRFVSRFLPVLSFVTLLLCAACAPNLADVQQPQSIANVGVNGERATAEQILQAIRMGATRKHWSIIGEQPGVEFARVTSGGHQATVGIAYNEVGWTIPHQESSPGLRYNPNYNGRQVIHHRYNYWVRHLNRAIQDALAELRVPRMMLVPQPTSGGQMPPAPALVAPAAPVAPVEPALP